MVGNLVGNIAAKEVPKVDGVVRVGWVAAGLRDSVRLNVANVCYEPIKGVGAPPSGGGMGGLPGRGEVGPNDAFGSHFHFPVESAVGDKGGLPAVTFIDEPVDAALAADFFVGGKHETKIIVCQVGAEFLEEADEASNGEFHIVGATANELTGMNFWSKIFGGSGNYIHVAGEPEARIFNVFCAWRSGD